MTEREKQFLIAEGRAYKTLAGGDVNQMIKLTLETGAQVRSFAEAHGMKVTDDEIVSFVKGSCCATTHPKI